MKHHVTLGLLALLGAPGTALAAGPAPLTGVRLQDTEEVALRVSSALPDGSYLIDRGTFDGLAVGDRVVFAPRGAAQVTGRVEEVRERNAVVRPDAADAILPLGTPGRAQVPASRFAEEEPEPAPRVPVPTRDDEPATGDAQEPPPGPVPDAPVYPKPDPVEGPGTGLPEHPGWSNADEDWDESQPLLTRIRPVDPVDRRPSMSGRIWVQGDQIFSTEDGRGDAFYRTGADLFYENPFGRGGDLHVDLEGNWRNARLPDEPDDQASRLRVDRLSYTVGDHRFSPHSWSFGRFLHRGVPEFGWLDGVEYGHTLENGDRTGAAIGYLPEPDRDFESGEDLAVSGYYTWVHDSSERLEATLGYQKTWHNFEADRDLVVAKIDYFPTSGWYWTGAAWIDFFSGGDDEEDDFLDFSQVYLGTGRNWAEYGIDFRYQHFEFPELLRNDFRPVEFDQLTNDRWDRLSVDIWAKALPGLDVYAGAGVFDDEDESGGDLLTGFSIHDLVGDGTTTRLEYFVTHAEFSTAFGGRASVSKADRFGSWELFYELLHNDADGFAADNDDLIQQRLRARRDFNTASGWSLSGYVEGVDYETEQGLLAGFLVSKSF